MCGIGGILELRSNPIQELEGHLGVMNELQSHRGPDGHATWQHERRHVGFAHRRLAVIDLKTGNQPMADQAGNWITYNGEIYNYIELREQLGSRNFRTKSDTEIILRAYEQWGLGCVENFRGMFAFALWDEGKQRLFCARDRFGMKPFYYTIIRDTFYFSSEIKALLPFMDKIETSSEGLKDYLTFQFCLAGKTLFHNIHELLPAHTLVIENGNITTKRYWEIYYKLDFDHTEKYFQNQIEACLQQSIEMHLRSDIPVGAYVSGGLDSGVVSSLAALKLKNNFVGFTGKFSTGADYDESDYARTLAQWRKFTLHEKEISPEDFVKNIRKIIYHLDFPTAGPGAFPQYIVAQFAQMHRKVILGGVGGDEIFGGYVRYLIAYFEQCIKAAIDGTMHSGNFIVTYESIIPNLISLKKYKPLLQDFWHEGLFEDMDKRYFRLINRSRLLQNEIRWDNFTDYSPYQTFKDIFLAGNVEKKSYFDSMTHFDFKTLLPALLQVEDRVSMAHGIESRLPLLDHPLVELAATIPSDVKFKNGTLKNVFKASMKPHLPEKILNRQDKMGFPVPLTEWMRSEIREFIYDIFSSSKSQQREFIDNSKVLEDLDTEPKFGRKIWGLLCLELWQQEFHDKQAYFQAFLKKRTR